jgi:hypothetical protein
MIGRAAVHQEHRKRFYEKYFNNPLCDLGQVNKNGNQEWIKPKISIGEHLKSKFILSLEGNDVATNLKWIMSSNSIAVSPPLKMETWYMEGTLNQMYILSGLMRIMKILRKSSSITSIMKMKLWK